MKAWRTLWVALAVAAMTIVACGDGGETSSGGTPGATEAGDGGDATSETSGDLRVATVGFQYESFVPAEGSQANHTYWEPVYDFMFYEEDGSITPGLIEDWELSEDALEYDMTVRSGVEWHNGRELDAEDIAFNFDYWISHEESNHSTSARLAEIVADVSVTGDHSLTVTLNEPMPLFLDWLSWTASSPVVPREYGEMSTGEINESPIGTGPWKLTERATGEYVRFEANPGHWRQSPAFETLEIRSVPEDSTRLAMLRQGEVDIIDAPLSLIPEVEGTGLEITSAEQALTTSVFLAGVYESDAPGYNPEIPWADRRVREALNLAVDKESIIDRIFFGEGEPAVMASLLPWQLGYQDDWESLPYDPEEAQRLLAEAGYEDGFSIQLHAYPRPGVPDLPTMVEAVASNWEAVGLDVEIVNSDWSGVVRPIVREREADFALGMALGVFPPDSGPLWWVAPNHFFETSDAINSGVDQIAESTTRDEIEQAITALGDAVVEERPFVPIAILNQIFVTNPDAVGEWPVVPHAGGINSLEYVTKP